MFGKKPNFAMSSSNMNYSHNEEQEGPPKSPKRHSRSSRGVRRTQSMEAKSRSPTPPQRERNSSDQETNSTHRTGRTNRGGISSSTGSTGSGGNTNKSPFKRSLTSPTGGTKTPAQVANDVLKSTVMAPMNLATWTGQAVVQAGTITGQAVVQASKNTVDATQAVTLAATHAVVDAGSTVGNSVVSGSKAIIGGTTNTVKMGGKSMVKGSVKLMNPIGSASRGMMRGLKQSHATLSKSIMGRSILASQKKSKWEEGIEAIDELLSPEGDLVQHMTFAQRQKLENVKKLLLKGNTSASSKIQHVPAELILMQSEHGSVAQSYFDLDEVSYASTSMAGGLGYDDTDSGSNFGGDFVSPKRRRSMKNNSMFLLEEYAGVKESTSLLGSNGGAMDDSTEIEEDVLPPAPTAQARTSSTPPRMERALAERPLALDAATADTASLTDENFTDTSDESGTNRAAGAAAKMARGSLPPDFQPPPKPQDDSDCCTWIRKDDYLFLPPEFTYMEREQQVELYNVLQWESLNKWDFNIFELDQLTQGKPMLFVGWAILAAPYAQQAMAKELGMEPPDNTKGYRFLDELHMPPVKLYNFIKAIEQDYTASNAYHNAIHGSDVLQSLHTLIQMSASQPFMKDCPKLYLFAILLSALVHDVAHFGTTNAFHKNLQTELAVLYNDRSVMESWHVARAFSIMFSMDLTKVYDGKDAPFSKLQQSSANLDCNLLCHATPDQFVLIRKLMIDAILHTDMTKHFEMVNAARATLLEQQQGGDDEDDSSVNQEEYTWRTLLFMLHMADISGQAKGSVLSMGWTKRCFDEFFAQGDQEASLGMPVSPNCDRHTVLIPDSQIGFINFVIQPAFEVLGEYIPFVQESVVPLVRDNLMFYVGQQKEQDCAVIEEEEEEEEPSALRKSTTSSAGDTPNLRLSTASC